MILDRIVSVKYLLPNATNADKEGFVANIALLNVRINIQPASDQTIALGEAGAEGRTFEGYITQSGIHEGNYLTTSGTGETYIVRGVKDWSWPKILPHYVLLLDRVFE